MNATKELHSMLFYQTCILQIIGLGTAQNRDKNCFRFIRVVRNIVESIIFLQAEAESNMSPMIQLPLRRASSIFP